MVPTDRKKKHKKIDCSRWYTMAYTSFLPLALNLESMSDKMLSYYPLHHVTYTPAKFEVATSNSLGADAFTRKKHYLTLTLRSTVILSSTLYVR